MTYLITGAAGFIGINLCEHLLEKRHTVIGVDNFITGSKENLNHLLSHPKFTFILSPIEDLTLRSKLEKFKIEEIYHLACPTGVPNLKILAKEMLIASSQGTMNILEIAKDHNARMLFASSSEIYGDPLVFPQSEDYFGNVNPIGTRSPYEEGKRFSEALCITWSHKYDLDILIARIFNTYGINFSLNDERVVPQFIMRDKMDLLVHGDGKQNRTFLYIDDLIGGLMTIMEKGIKSAVYNVGSDKQISILDLAKLIIKLRSTNNNICFIERSPSDHQSRLPSIEKIKKLGWSPKISLTDGLRKTIEFFKTLDNQ